MEKVKVFSDYSDKELELQVNEFLSKNADIEITDRILSTTVYPGEYCTTIAIFYKEQK